MKKILTIALFCALATPSSVALAGEADVTKVDIKKTGDRTFTFRVTLAHADTGWDHYADKWEVVAPDGTVLATRILAHPHVNEQPFTRSKSGIKIPEGVDQVTVRGGDSVHGIGGKEMVVEID